MTETTLLVRDDADRVTVTFDRPGRGNAFNMRLLAELNAVLDRIEAESRPRLVVIEGRDGVFCKGLDLQDLLEAGDRPGGGPEPDHSARLYIETLRRLTLFPRLVVAVVDGAAMAGGLGFVAASDVAVATPRSQFSLPEAVWGLVPACVGLYVLRRTGFQAAYRLALTTELIAAPEALSLGLVDQVTETPEEVLRRLSVKAGRLAPATVGDIKRYFRAIGAIDPEREERAVMETDRLMADARVREAITDYVRYQRFPWNRP
ncbi:enoyl-CoA hydratase-related protein [Azospirillum argentinense]|uniref:enoyl-CoA hydratase-related protein n=1 Tax=Azospirillum argentinense TaxID=2970906 RepID=UPI0027DB1F9A|nr:enoyl-CoA hydratase-related protein [Azospirillum argentinense]